jgi:hypothetical protein
MTTTTRSSATATTSSTSRGLKIDPTLARTIDVMAELGSPGWLSTATAVLELGRRPQREFARRVSDLARQSRRDGSSHMVTSVFPEFGGDEVIVVTVTGARGQDADDIENEHARVGPDQTVTGSCPGPGDVIKASQHFGAVTDRHPEPHRDPPHTRRKSDQQRRVRGNHRPTQSNRVKRLPVAVEWIPALGLRLVLVVGGGAVGVGGCCGPITSRAVAVDPVMADPFGRR